MDKIEEDMDEDGTLPTLLHKQSSTKLDKVGKKGVSININSKVKNAILDSINMMIDEIESVHEVIAEQAKEHIHANDAILTYGCSKVLNQFFEVSFFSFYLTRQQQRAISFSR